MILRMVLRNQRRTSQMYNFLSSCIDTLVLTEWLALIVFSVQSAQWRCIRMVGSDVVKMQSRTSRQAGDSMICAHRVATDEG